MRKLSEAEKAELQKKLAQPKVRRKSVFDKLLEKFYLLWSGYIPDELIHRVSARVSNMNTRLVERTHTAGGDFAYHSTKYTASIITVVFQSNDSSLTFEFDSDETPLKLYFFLRFLSEGDRGILVTRAGKFIDFYKNMTMEDFKRLSGKTDKAT